MGANKPPDLSGDMSTGEWSPEAKAAREARSAANDQRPTPGLILRMALRPSRIKASLVPSTQAALAAVDELEDALHDAARKFTLIGEELASLRRDALRWADETYDESMAKRIRERLDV